MNSPRNMVSQRVSLVVTTCLRPTHNLKKFASAFMYCLALLHQRLTADAMKHRYLDPAWSKDHDIRLEHYTNARVQAEMNLLGKKVRQVTSLDCMAGTWSKCAKQCARCSVQFHHHDDKDFVVKDSMIAGQGLFTTSRIFTGGIMLLEYKGKILKAAQLSGNLAYTMCLDKARYIQAHEGIHMRVNHSCQPNCRLLKWRDGDGTAHLSISSLNGINPNEELTVDYGAAPSWKLFACHCPECTKELPVGDECTKELPAGDPKANDTSISRHVTRHKRKRRKNVSNC